IQYKNAFYGTTISGGNPSGGGVGTIFKVTPAGSETVLHIFTGQPDGADSHAALIAYNANFYGMTEEGGSKGLGTVFKMTPKGKLTIIHNFTNSQGEGYHPFGATLLNVNGTFYGSLSSTYVGSGGIFQITPSGSESLAYVFGDNIAGVYSDVIDVGGLLYGTTINGGPAEQGTVYAVPL
ncbi:MAG: choice-of-anchor tandem repeat GloVer-containing protein, partial [Candidatus Tumulicola sp.]